MIRYDTLLQNAIDIITKCDTYFITKCDKRSLQNASGFLLQNTTVLLQNWTVIRNSDDLLQNGTFITNCDSTVTMDTSSTIALLRTPFHYL